MFSTECRIPVELQTVQLSDIVNIDKSGGNIEEKEENQNEDRSTDYSLTNRKDVNNIQVLNKDIPQLADNCQTNRTQKLVFVRPQNPVANEILSSASKASLPASTASVPKKSTTALPAAGKVANAVSQTSTEQAGKTTKLVFSIQREKADTEKESPKATLLPGNTVFRLF